MDKNEDIFGGFSAVADSLSGIKDEDGITIMDPLGGNDPIVEPPVEDEEDETKVPPVVEEEEDEDDDLTDAEKEAIELSKSKGKSKSKQSDTTTTEDESEDEDNESDLGDAEEEIAEFIQEKVFERFNLEVDGEDFKKFEYAVFSEKRLGFGKVQFSPRRDQIDHPGGVTMIEHLEKSIN